MVRLGPILAIVVAMTFPIPTRAGVFPVGPTRITEAMRNGSWLTVTVNVSEEPIPSTWRERLWGTDETPKTKRIVHELTISWADTSVWIPLSAFSDLSNPRSLAFVPTKKGYSFRIQGGMDSADYEARFFVVSKSLIRRRVTMLVDPDLLSEDTHYGVFYPRE